MKCASCGEQSSFWDGYVTGRGFFCDQCHTTEPAWFFKLVLFFGLGLGFLLIDGIVFRADQGANRHGRVTLEKGWEGAGLVAAPQFIADTAAAGVDWIEYQEITYSHRDGWGAAVRVDATGSVTRGSVQDLNPEMKPMTSWRIDPVAARYVVYRLEAMHPDSYAGFYHPGGLAPVSCTLQRLKWQFGRRTGRIDAVNVKVDILDAATRELRDAGIGVQQ